MSSRLGRDHVGSTALATCVRQSFGRALGLGLGLGFSGRELSTQGKGEFCYVWVRASVRAGLASGLGLGSSELTIDFGGSGGCLLLSDQCQRLVYLYVR